MGKLIAIVFIVVAVWAGLEVSNKGTSGAFGGVFASGETEAVTPAATVPQRAGRAVEGAHAASEERRERMLGE